MNEPKPNRIYGVIGKWKDQCTNYQEMKEKCVKLLEHPEATEEQLLETARCLRDVRKRMSAMQEQLNSSFTQYKFDLTGKVLPKAYLRAISPRKSTTTV